MERSSQFDRDAAERVLRRAIELAEADSASDHDGVSEQALLEAADELGVDPLAVRRAATEERLGLLRRDARRLDRLAGPPEITVSGVIDEPAPAAMARADQWLRRHGPLRRRRLDAEGRVADYVRRSDAIAGVQRTVRTMSGKEHLGRVRRLRVVVQPWGEDRSIVALVADLQVERTVAIAGGSSIAGIGSSVSAVEALTAAPWLWVGVPVSFAVGASALWARARTVPDVEVALGGVLDRLIAGDAPSGMIDDVRERLLRARPGRPGGAAEAPQ